MDESDVAAYVERSEPLIESSPQMDEQNTKAKLIRPLIELLGWDVYSSEVELEYSMQIGRGNTRADYALILEGTPVVFIEAKGCDSTLADSDRKQLASYMRQTGVDWGLLTNGTTFEILKRRTDSNRPEEILLGSFSLTELTENRDRLELLSKELVESGEANSIAERMEATRNAVRILRSKKEHIAERVTQVVTDEIGDIPAQEIQSVSKEYIDELADTLENASDVQGEHGHDGGERHDETESEAQYVITLNGDGTVVESFSGSNQSAVMAAAVDHLISEQGLLNEIESLPYVPGEKNALLNTEPCHPSGNEMRTYRRVSDDYYVFTSLNRKSKQRYVEQFAERCGLTAGFDGLW
jgi:hypothetical protein